MSRTTAMKGNPLELVGPELRPGDKAPDFRLVGKDLREVALPDYKGTWLILSVIPSIDTSVCAMQTRRFNDEVRRISDNTKILTVSCDLPFALSRFCEEYHITIPYGSDHREASFGAAYGTLIQPLRLESRAVFLVDPEGIVRYVEYVPDMGNAPDFDRVLSAVRELAR
jgi:thioredoxin-dependent peroxiredoxin